MNYLDVHGDSKDIAIKKICKKASELSLNNAITSFCVIHGYNSGTSLLKAIRKFDFKCKYILKIYPDPQNEGRSFIYLNKRISKL